MFAHALFFQQLRTSVFPAGSVRKWEGRSRVIVSARSNAFASTMTRRGCGASSGWVNRAPTSTFNIGGARRSCHERWGRPKAFWRRRRRLYLRSAARPGVSGMGTLP